MDFAFIHIRKAGGTALKHMLSMKAAREAASGIKLCDHPTTLVNIWAARPEIQAFFIVRDPVERYVSGFNGRLRQGRPRFHTPWNRQEEEAFRVFQRPNELAEALSAPSQWRRAAARLAMLSIRHVSDPLSYWLISPQFLEENRGRISFVSWLPKLNDELPTLLRILGLPSGLRLPNNPVKANRAPRTSILSPLGRANIEQWYSEDYDIIDWCLRWREDNGLSNSRSSSIETVE